MADVVSLIPVLVGRHTLFVVDAGDGMVPIRPICEALGVSFQGQVQKLRNHPSYGSTIKIILTVGADGKAHEMACMPAWLVPGFLMMVHPNKVDEASRETLILFQRDGSRLLYEALMSVRSGLPLQPASAQGEMFALDEASAWLRHPAVQEAVSYRLQAEKVQQAAADKARGLRRESVRRVKRLGIRARHLDLMAAALTLPPAPPPADDLPLLAGG